MLESALSGPMSTRLPPDEKARLLTWVRDGASKPEYDLIKPIVDKRCMACHSGSNPHLPNRSDFDNLKKVTALTRAWLRRWCAFHTSIFSG